jgi:glucosamine--fructose-6-phosphate aminotransferase (isomerizing)|tara:strand:- start:237 stop:1244 length:1008 start_codon:yes stop_codon:yes gene_type:complete
MNKKDRKYRKSALVKEMLESVDIIKNFNAKDLEKPIKSIKKTKKLFLSGEGSSRIFPAKNMINLSLKKNSYFPIYTEGARQAAELNLKDFTLFGASNSGKTKEVISLFKNKKANSKFVITENPETKLKKYSNNAYLLNCGKEKAVSATKSVVEEALFYQNLLLKLNGKGISKKTLNELSRKANKILTMKINNNIIKKLSKSKVLYFAGRNDGVAEEATLKTNEITRKKSCYLEGTYAVHGIEEAMGRNEAVILINPFKEEEKKFKEVLVKGVGMEVIAISSRKTAFPTIKIPSMKDFDGYLQLLACWNLLVEVGLKLRVNLDKPKRARKIGNELR